MTTMKRFSACWSDKLGAAIRDESPEVYTMSLVGEDRRALADIVNQGIDSRLEACYVPDRGDSYLHVDGRIECVISSKSLVVLVRRLLESGDDAAMSVASGICQTLDIELV